MMLRRIKGIIGGHFLELLAVNTLLVFALLPGTALLSVFRQTGLAAAWALAGPAFGLAGAVYPPVIFVLTSLLDGTTVYLGRDLLGALRASWLRGGVTGCAAGWSAGAAVLALRGAAAFSPWGAAAAIWLCWLAAGIYTGLFFQYARIEAPAIAQVRNSVVLPVACGLRGAAAILIQLALACLFPITALLPLWLLGVPALVELCAAALLWPPMRRLYEGDGDGAAE